MGDSQIYQSSYDVNKQEEVLMDNELLNEKTIDSMIRRNLKLNEDKNSVELDCYEKRDSNVVAMVIR
jgi:hypothetical protein